MKVKKVKNDAGQSRVVIFTSFSIWRVLTFSLVILCKCFGYRVDKVRGICISKDVVQTFLHPESLNAT